MPRAGIAYLRLYAIRPPMLPYGLTQLGETTIVGGPEGTAELTTGPSLRHQNRRPLEASGPQVRQGLVGLP